VPRGRRKLPTPRQRGGRIALSRVRVCLGGRDVDVDDEQEDALVSDVNAAVIYYSATGSIYAMARAAGEAAEKAGAEVRLRKVHELAPQEAIASNEGWSAHARETQDVPEAALDDLEWADVLIFGTPTRYGLPTAQLKQFIDTSGPLWAAGKLVNKVATSFTSTGTAHGGQETTITALNNTFYHWGAIVVAPGYADPIQFEAGNPYGASHISNNGVNPPGETELRAVGFQATRAVEIGRALKIGLAAA
jgi:NAD(P)H dehydrogenase (quinone)